MRTCPVRDVTPEADAVIGLFDRAYEMRVNGFSSPTYQLVALPGPGGLADQDAWTMEALAWIRDVRNRLEQDRAREDSKRPAPVTADEPLETVDG